MAKENFVLIAGQVCSKPRLYMSKDNDGRPFKATMLIKTVRRHIIRNNLTSINNGSTFDIIPIATFNADMINACTKINQYDMVEIRGVYTTKENVKRTFCENCGELNQVEGVDTFITPVFIKVIDRVKSEEYPNGFDVNKSIEILKSYAEISNTVKIIGTLCRDPEKIANVKMSSAQYQIASNRRFRIREDNPNARTDYPWIKTFGPQAEEDFKALHMGSTIYIDGCMQARAIKRKQVCEHCGNENIWEDSAYEIIPYSVEYLTGCTLPEPTDPDKKKGD